MCWRQVSKGSLFIGNFLEVMTQLEKLVSDLIDLITEANGNKLIGGTYPKILKLLRLEKLI